ncbi:hypothetical protein TRFO_11064 [Tritrichomonas foetus]|uniref:Uncharacterized protein n=1 Tax=Tritrichomonas foetus TaxID=1144522 RepID=A0A1J4J9Y8_9EUKA|nr:hypothetical protein TRFO_11064 [Tritrichomonas foetus]|eukprot:OHS94459.1 hypothetical protein TRFO_11064 [Tritrichomonas foetus]
MVKTIDLPDFKRSQMNKAVDWQIEIEKEINEMERELLNKAERADAEQIFHHQEEKILQQNNQKDCNNEQQQQLYYGPESMCQECVELNDINSAFSILLRYIEATSENKAERNEVNGKATKTYVDNIYERLSSISKVNISEKTGNLTKELETKLNELNSLFDQIGEDVGKRLNQTENNLFILNQQMEDFNKIEIKNHPKDKNQGKIQFNFTKTHQFNFRTELTPRRKILKKSFDMSREQTISKSRMTPYSSQRTSLIISKLKP